MLDAVGANFLVQIMQKVIDDYMKKIESIQKQKEQVLF
jgi:ribosome recycling factor